jgi:hypothetical protein
MHYHSEEVNNNEDAEKARDYLEEIAEAKIENAILTYEYGLIAMDTERDIEENDNNLKRQNSSFL